MYGKDQYIPIHQFKAIDNWEIQTFEDFKSHAFQIKDDELKRDILKVIARDKYMTLIVNLLNFFNIRFFSNNSVIIESTDISLNNRVKFHNLKKFLLFFNATLNFKELNNHIEKYPEINSEKKTIFIKTIVISYYKYLYSKIVSYIFWNEDDLSIDYKKFSLTTVYNEFENIDLNKQYGPKFNAINNNFYTNIYNQLIGKDYDKMHDVEISSIKNTETKERLSLLLKTYTEFDTWSTLSKFIWNEILNISNELKFKSSHDKNKFQRPLYFYLLRTLNKNNLDSDERLYPFSHQNTHLYNPNDFFIKEEFKNFKMKKKR